VAGTRHPSYSPDLTSIDLFLLRKVKITVSGRRSEYVEDIKKSVIAAFNAVSLGAFSGCFVQPRETFKKPAAVTGDTLRENYTVSSQFHVYLVI
jgi:hypothetical protein